MPPIWVGFWVQNFLKKGLLFGKFSLNMDGFTRNVHYKSGYDINCR